MKDEEPLLKSNFYSVIRGKTIEDVNHIFQQQGWVIRKSSMKDFEISNSWAELCLDSSNNELLLHGPIIYHPDNVKIIKRIFENMHCAYKFEFYNDFEIIEESSGGNL